MIKDIFTKKGKEEPLKNVVKESKTSTFEKKHTTKFNAVKSNEEKKVDEIIKDVFEKNTKQFNNIKNRLNEITIVPDKSNLTSALSKNINPISNKNHHVWKFNGQEIIHKEYGIIDVSSLVPYKDFEVLAIIPINVEYCFFLFISSYKERKFLYLKDIRYEKNENKLSSFFMFKFFAPGYVMRAVRAAISSCKGESGTMSVGFFFRLIYGQGINSFGMINKKKRYNGTVHL